MEELIPHVYGVDPINGVGLHAFRLLRVEMQGAYKIKVKILSTDSPYKQGIALSLRGEPLFVGKVLVNEQPLSSKKRLNHVVPVDQYQNNEFVIDAEVENGRLLIASASDILGDFPGILEKIASQTRKPLTSLPDCSFTSGFSAANMYGNGFIVEVLSSSAIRCRCNDHVKDSDYNDMVFEVRIER